MLATYFLTLFLCSEYRVDFECNDTLMHGINARTVPIGFNAILTGNNDKEGDTTVGVIELSLSTRADN